MPKILLTGIPSDSLFYAEAYRDFSISYKERRAETRTFGDLLTDMQVSGNTGNLLIGEGAKGAFEGTDSTYLPFWFLMEVAKDKSRLAELRKSFDFVVMATANIIRSDHSAHVEADLLEAINLPTLMMGAGIQVESQLSEVPEGTLRLIKFLADGGHHVFTRGMKSANYLTDKGIENVTPTGCPSIYLKPDGMRQALSRLCSITDLEFEQVMIGGYIGHAATNRDINFLSTVSARQKFVLQDEFLHYNLQIEKKDSLERIYDAYTGEIHSPYHHPAEQPEDIKPPIHIFTSTGDWRRWAAESDLFFGRRFHGGIIAMQMGVPALFVSIDDRMKEMLEWMGFPFVDTKEFTPAPDKAAFLKDWISGLDRKAVLKKYNAREKAFRKALKQLGLWS